MDMVAVWAQSASGHVQVSSSVVRDSAVRIVIAAGVHCTLALVVVECTATVLITTVAVYQYVAAEGVLVI
jgi:hypothetical protein